MIKYISKEIYHAGEIYIMELNEILKWRQNAAGFHGHIGMNVTEIAIGTSTVTVKVTPELRNPLGMAHGGVIFSVCDMAAGTAAASEGRVAVTLSGNINYLKAGMPDRLLIAKATAVKVGKTTGIFDVRVTDDKDTLVATATFTMFYTGKLIEEIAR